jgi:glycosyltransferase involved in cell wall biosynthesis
MERDVIIDATRAIQRALVRMPNGTDRVSLAYIEHYQDRAQAWVFDFGSGFLMSPSASRRLWKLLLSRDMPFRSSRLELLMLWGRLAALASFRRMAGGIMINSEFVGLERPAYQAVLLHLRVKRVFFIHDLLPITHAESFRPNARIWHMQKIDFALKHGAALIVNSRETLHQLTEHARRICTPLPPTVAALLAPGLRKTAPAQRPIAEPYFVILGTIEPRKNHWLLLQIWRKLIERAPTEAPKLVVIGQRGWECENVVDLLERCEPLRGFVIEHSSCTDFELNNYLYHAQALLFPTFAEGYGMPLVEALTLGVPAIVSDLQVFREIAGDIPEYIDPLDGIRWAELITDYARPVSSRRASQLERLRSFKHPTWSEHFAAVDEMIGRLSTPDWQQETSPRTDEATHLGV